MAVDLNALEPPPAVAAASAPPEAAPPLPAQAAQAPTDQMGAIPAGQAPMAPMVREDPGQTERAHESIIGRAFRHLAGKEMTYSVDPTTGKTVTTPVPQQPGQFFRSILAGAILGGAMGTGSGGLAQGIAKGGAAVGEQQERTDLIKRNQAQQDYANNLKREQVNMEKERLTLEKNRDQREAAAALTEDQVRKATIAHANAMTARENQLMVGTSWDQHQDAAKNGLTKVEPYKVAGIAPTYEGVAESKMQDILKANPGLVSLDWEPVAVKAVVQPDGKVNHEFVYNAYDPNKTVKMTPALIDLYTKAGMDKYYPNWDQVVKPGKELSPTQFAALKGQYQQLANEQTIRDKQQADIKHTKAETEQALAAAAHSRALTDEVGVAKTKQQQLKKAMDSWNSAMTKDPSLDSAAAFEKLPPGDQALIGESMSATLGHLNDAVNSTARELAKAQEPGSGQKVLAEQLQGELNKLVEQRSAVSRLATFSATRAGVVQPPKPDHPGAVLPADVAQKYFQRYGSPDAARAAAVKDGWIIAPAGGKDVGEKITLHPITPAAAAAPTVSVPRSPASNW